MGTRQSVRSVATPLTSIVDAAVQLDDHRPTVDLVDELREGLLARHVESLAAVLLLEVDTTITRAGRYSSNYTNSRRLHCDFAFNLTFSQYALGDAPLYKYDQAYEREYFGYLLAICCVWPPIMVSDNIISLRMPLVDDAHVERRT